MSLYIDKTSYRSPNYDDRPNGETSAIVLHSGEGTKKSDLETLLNDNVPPIKRVSAHYYVDRQGNVYELVDPHKRAWHAGTSLYLGRTSWNDFAIGIETEHKSGQNWPQSQCTAIKELCEMLIGQFHIQQKWIAAHRWLAPRRRSDPSNWSNESLNVWISNLYVEHLYDLPGLVHPMPCGKGFYDFYTLHGGFGMYGYALTPEALDLDSLGRKCSWMRFERAVLKYVEGEGVHLALLVEAINKRWAI